MASSADIEVQCLADAAAYIERHGWPRSRLAGWRCAPVPRVSNPAHWDPYWISSHNEVARSPKYVLALVADYVQCKTCSALRRLPGPLSRLAETAPDSLATDWSCKQNTSTRCVKKSSRRHRRECRLRDIMSTRASRVTVLSTQVGPRRRLLQRR